MAQPSNQLEAGFTQAPSDGAYGFTLVELLVVLFIMGIIAGTVIANFAGSRDSRNLHIAMNELLTNIRKVQSYSLSSRTLPGGKSVEYYVIKFDTQQPNQYVIEAIYNVKSPPAQVQDIETINLPAGITLGNFLYVNSQNTGCLLLAFKAPFAQVITNAKVASCTGGPGAVTNGDDYDLITKFAVNVNGSTVNDNTQTVIPLQAQGLPQQMALVNGSVGLVCPTDWTTSDLNPPACVVSY